MKDHGTVTNARERVSATSETEGNPQGGDMVRLDEALAEALHRCAIEGCTSPTAERRCPEHQAQLYRNLVALADRDGRR